MINILVISDIHIGSKANVKDLYDNELYKFIEVLPVKKPNMVVIAGDLYDKRISTNSDFNTYTNLFVNEIVRYCRENDCILCIVKGTLAHDLNQLDSFIYLTKDPNNKTYIFNTCQEFYYKNAKFLFIPEEYESSKEEYYKDTLFNENKYYDMVFGHGMMTFAGGYVTESGKNNHIVFDPKDFSRVYGLVVFGHIHIGMRKDKCIYPGSYSRDSFGEDEPKGCLFIKYDENNHKVLKEEFIENKNAPIYKTINARDVPDENIGVFINNELKTCFKLRIVIDSDISEKKYNDLKACSYDNNNLVLYKRMRGLSKKEDDEKNEELEKHRSERRALIDKYSKMDFYEITSTYAKEKMNVDISRDEIKESLL